MSLIFRLLKKIKLCSEKILIWWRYALFVALFLFLFYISHIHHHLRGYIEGFIEIGCLKKIQIKPVCDRDFFLIAHAGGGINGKTYLNTLNSINRAYKLGYKYLELDINKTKDGFFVLSHDFVEDNRLLFLQDSSSGVRLTLDDLMAWLINKDIKVITDVKIKNVEALSFIRKKYPSLVEKIIPQTFHIHEIVAVNKLGYKNIIFTNYVANYPPVILKKISALKILFGITIPYESLAYNRLLIEKYFNFSPTPFFVHTINDNKVLKKVKENGVCGLYTDFITPLNYNR